MKTFLKNVLTFVKINSIINTEDKGRRVKTMIKNYLNAKIDYSKNKDLKYYKSNSNIKTIETKKDELIEKFTYKNVNTIREEKKHHCETRSLILTPYNSEISKYSNTSIEIERKICKFCPSVKQLDLKYELNNNAQFDNGIINTENLSFLNDEDDINTSPISISPHLEKGNNQIKEIFPTINTIFVEYIENNIGYDQEYLRSELKKKEINYATATYYLISKDDV